MGYYTYTMKYGTAKEKEVAREIVAEKREERELLRAEFDEALALVHPAFHGYAYNSQCCFGNELPTNDMCQAFCLEQVAKLGKKARSEAVKAELRTIYAAIRSQGGDAYAANKARLIELSK